MACMNVGRRHQNVFRCLPRSVLPFSNGITTVVSSVESRGRMDPISGSTSIISPPWIIVERMTQTTYGLYVRTVTLAKGRRHYEPQVSHDHCRAHLPYPNRLAEPYPQHCGTVWGTCLPDGG